MITSMHNEQVRYWMNLQKSSRFRRESGCFLVEGEKILTEISPEILQKIVITDKFLRETDPSFLQKLDKVPKEVVSEDIMRHIADTVSPQGICGVVTRMSYTMSDLFCKDRPPLLVVLESIRDPGNLGTIFRSAEAAGATGIILSSDTVDWSNPKVVRSAMGAAFRVPFLVTEDLKDSIKKLKNDFVKIYAAHLDGPTSYEDECYTEASAFLIGNESKGLTDETADLADRWIRIPMSGKAESLNAAQASTVLLFEAARQRRKNRVKL